MPLDSLMAFYNNHLGMSEFNWSVVRPLSLPILLLTFSMVACKLTRGRIRWKLLYAIVQNCSLSIFLFRFMLLFSTPRSFYQDTQNWVQHI
jgi:hypothetical protein